MSSFLPKVKVVGVGGAGSNAVANMIQRGLTDAEFLVANTDLQALTTSICENRVQLGFELTGGLGAGASPSIGADAALESKDSIIEYLRGSHVAFIAAGMGGGTGTGAAPIIANLAKEMGILTIGIVTKPFIFEGSERLRTAEQGIAEMEKSVDTLIVVSNQHLFRVANEQTGFADAFKDTDGVLHDAVKCISDLFTKPGLINLDLADVRSIISDRGMAMIGSGESSGPDKARRAVELAITNPLLDDLMIESAEGLLLNVTGGIDMKLLEVELVATAISDKILSANPDAKFIFGATIDPSIEDSLRVSIIAAGVKKQLLSGGGLSFSPSTSDRKSFVDDVSQAQSSSSRVSSDDLLDDDSDVLADGISDKIDSEKLLDEPLFSVSDGDSLSSEDEDLEAVDGDDEFIADFPMEVVDDEFLDGDLDVSSNESNGISGMSGIVHSMMNVQSNDIDLIKDSDDTVDSYSSGAADQKISLSKDFDFDVDSGADSDDDSFPDMRKNDGISFGDDGLVAGFWGKVNRALKKRRVEYDRKWSENDLKKN